LIAAFGFWGVHATALHRDEQACAKLAALLVDRRWPRPLALVRSTQKPGAPLFPWPKGKLAPAKFEHEARVILRSDATRGFHGLSSRIHDAHAYAHIEAGHEDFTGRPDGTEFPFEARLFCRAGGAVDGWVELVHEVAALLATANAVIFAIPDERHVHALLYSVGGGSDEHATPRGREIRRVEGSRRELGARQIRAAEWGTYLSAGHVNAVGRENLIAAAATSREVGSLLYVQCSTTATEAFTAEAEARRQALRTLLAPITV